jgi:hypothetical protein
VEPQPVILGKRDAKATVVRRDCARLDPFTGSTRRANAATAGRFMTLARLSFDDSLLEKPLNPPIAWSDCHHVAPHSCETVFVPLGPSLKENV